MQPISHHTCRLWLISFSYVNLIVLTPKIKLGEVSCISMLIEEIIDARDGILILDVDLVECLCIIKEKRHASFGITRTHYRLA